MKNSIILFSLLLAICFLVAPVAAQESSDPEPEDEEIVLEEIVEEEEVTDDEELSIEDEELTEEMTEETEEIIPDEDSEVDVDEVEITEEESEVTEKTYREPEEKEKEVIKDETSEDVVKFGETLQEEEQQPSLEDVLPNISEEQSKEISRYYEEAYGNYQDILESRPEKEYESAEKRYNANENILRNHKGKLAKSESGLRRLKLEYIRRFVIVRDAYRKGSFNDEIYNRELSKLSREYETKIRDYSDDISHHRTQAQKTKDKLRALSEFKRLNRILRYDDPKTVKKAKRRKKKAKKLSELEKMMSNLQSTGLFKTKNIWNAPDRK